MAENNNENETPEALSNPNRFINIAGSVGAITCMAANIYFIRRGVETGFSKEIIGMMAATGVIGHAFLGREHVMNVLHGRDDLLDPPEL